MLNTPGAAPVDADDEATSIDLGGFAGIADNAPVRSIFDLINVGTLISTAQEDAGNDQNRVIARDTPVPVGQREDGPVFNLRSASYRWPVAKDLALTVGAENSVYGQQTYLYSPRYSTGGVDNAHPDRTDGRLGLSYGNEFRVFGGLNYNLLTSPLSRSQVGNGGVRESRGSLRQDLAGVEGGVGWYRQVFSEAFQVYAKGTVGSGTGRARFRLVTLGHARDPRTPEQKLTDTRTFLEADYFEVAAGKIPVRSLYGIAETGVLFRFLDRFAVRLGVFLQTYTYAIPGIEGHLYFRAATGAEAFTPLQFVPSNVVQNLDTIRGLSFSFLVKI